MSRVVRDQQQGQVGAEADRQPRVVHAVIGELLRELTINTDRDYQPKTRKIRTPSEGSDLSYLLRDHICSGGSVLVQDIPDTCLTTSRTDVSRHRKQPPASVAPCRRHAWSSPPSPSSTAPSPRSSPVTASAGPGSTNSSRYRVEGEAAFLARSRRPHTSPNALDPTVVDLILLLRKQLAEQGHDAGPET